MPLPGGDDDGESTGLDPFENVTFTSATHPEGISTLPIEPDTYREFDGSLLIFYGATEYETDRKDNFWYEVIPDPDDTPPYDARLLWDRGRDGSKIRIRSTVIGIPPWIQISYREIHHRENAEYDEIDLPDYPEGWTGVVITEVLGEVSNGDDDHGYRIYTDNCRSSDPKVRISHGFDSNKKNDLIIRLTQLRWRSTLNIVARCERFTLPVVDSDGTRLRLPESDSDKDSYLIPELTTYWPDHLWRNSGSGADDDMSYEYRTSDDPTLGSEDPYLEGRYTNHGYLTLTLYELDLWPDQ